MHKSAWNPDNDNDDNGEEAKKKNTICLLQNKS